MQKTTHDYDNVFKTMKSKHKRLFIPIINDTFGKDYPLDAEVETLPSEGYLTESETPGGQKEIKEKISDFLIKIRNDIYLLECQSYDDGSMAIRVAEYAFIVARQYATWDIGHATIRMPKFLVIYIKKTAKTPEKTIITFIFPDGQTVDYESRNVILEQFTKEEIIRKRLFPYIPFYVARYEKEITSEKNIDHAATDLIYFRDEMIRLHEEGALSDIEIADLMGFVNTIITHITDGNKNEERLVNIMGGTIIETESERLIRVSTERGMEQGMERGMKRGMEQGMRQRLVQQVCLKLQKNKPAEVIAAELEADLDEVKEIIIAQQKVGSYDVAEICKEMNSQTITE